METEQVLEEKARLLGELLKESEVDKQKLVEQLSQLFEGFFGETLNYIEVALPFERSQNGQKSENEIQYGLLRSKILRAGNDKIRDMKDVLSDYLIRQMFQRTKMVISFPHHKIIGGNHG